MKYDHQKNYNSLAWGFCGKVIGSQPSLILISQLRFFFASLISLRALMLVSAEMWALKLASVLPEWWRVYYAHRRLLFHSLALQEARQDTAFLCLDVNFIERCRGNLFFFFSSSVLTHSLGVYPYVAKTALPIYKREISEDLQKH